MIDRKIKKKQLNKFTPVFHVHIPRRPCRLVREITTKSWLLSSQSRETCTPACWLTSQAVIYHRWCPMYTRMCRSLRGWI